MEIFLVLHHTGLKYLNLFGLLECRSSHVADFNTRNKILTVNFSNKATGITISVNFFKILSTPHRPSIKI